MTKKIISTRNLGNLPEPDKVLAISQSIAMLDAIIEPTWDMRYYTFDSHWSQGASRALMQDGEGDTYSILFHDGGAIIIGDAHESRMANTYVEIGRPWPGVIDDVPDEYDDALTEPAFLTSEATFCIWWEKAASCWKIGDISFPSSNDPDGSEDLLFILDGKPSTYQQWAEEYYGRSLSFKVIEQIYLHQPLTNYLIKELNPNRDSTSLVDDINQIGYPAYR